MTCAYHDVLDDCGAPEQTCSWAGCGAERADHVGLSLPDGEYGFCSPSCFVLFVRDRWMLGASA